MTFLELMATLSIDTSKYDEGLDKATGTARSAGSRIGSALATAGKVTVAAVGAAAVGVGKLASASVEAYGEFEQLQGGVEKIFGDSADVIMGYANDAYKSAGLSANNYMQTVTSFSASLLQGLGGDTEAAAEIANKAIIDMADNANTYGTDIESIQNAYMGFAKNNFTMLDNLKLGYGGTQSEMVRLINDAGILEEKISDLDNVTFDQMIEAIHIIQENTNIAGTTANEAATTIQGSVGMMQSAWQNLVTGLSNPDADLGVLINNMVESAKIALGNIIPAVSQALTGIASLIENTAPIIADELPGLITQVLPSLLSAATSIVAALISALPSILNVLVQQLPVILGVLFPAIMDILPQLLSTVSDLLITTVNFLADNADMIVPAIISIIGMVVTTLYTPEVLGKLLEGGLRIIGGLIAGLAEATPDLLALIPEIIANMIGIVVEVAPEFGQTVLGLLGSLGTLILNTVGSIMGLSREEVAESWDAFVDWCGDAFDNLLGDIGNFGADVIESFFSTFEDVKDTVSDAVDALIDMFDFDWSLPQIKLPHFSIRGGEAPWGFAGQGSFPSVSIQWYKKAMNAPMLLDSATIFGYAGGQALGGGEAGDEMIYGRDNLMRDIADVVDAKLNNLQFVVPVYIGGKKIDQQIITASARANVISGGR